MYKIFKYKSKLQTATTNAKKQIYKSKLNYYQLGGNGECYCGCPNQPSAAAATAACICHPSHKHATSKTLEKRRAFHEEGAMFKDMKIPPIRDMLYEYYSDSMYEPDTFDSTSVFNCICPKRDHTLCFINKYKNVDYGGFLNIKTLTIHSFIDLEVLLLELEKSERENLPESWKNKFGANSQFLGFNLTTLIISSDSKINELPETLIKLKYLRDLRIQNTEIRRLCNLPELTHLNCSETNIRYIPNTFVELKELDCSNCLLMYNIPNTLTKLKTLTCYNCPQMEKIPNTLTKLKKLNFAHCKKISEIPAEFVNLKELNCTGCSLIRFLPNTLTQLTFLNCSFCSGIPEIPAEFINLETIHCSYTNIQYINITNMGKLTKVVDVNNQDVSLRLSVIRNARGRLLLPTI